MEESKRSKLTKNASSGSIKTDFKPDMRPVYNIEFFNSQSNDGTKSMKTYISGLVDYTCEYGLPIHLHFYLTKNQNSNSTSRNNLLDLYIPILPIAWNINSRESVNSFIKNAKTPENTWEILGKMTDEEILKRQSQYTDKIISYITTELLIRYYIAKKHGDEIVANQIQNLNIIETSKLDLDLTSAILDNPKCLRHKSGKHYLVYTTDNGENLVEISTEQAKDYSAYREILKKHHSTKEHFSFLNKAIESYKVQDIVDYRNTHTIESHSLNNKFRGNDVVSTQPKQPGENE